MIPPTNPLAAGHATALAQARQSVTPMQPPPERTVARSDAPRGTLSAPPLVGPPPTFDMTMLEHLRRILIDPARGGRAIAPPPDAETDPRAQATEARHDPADGDADGEPDDPPPRSTRPKE